MADELKIGDYVIGNDSITPNFWGRLTAIKDKSEVVIYPYSVTNSKQEMTRFNRSHIRKMTNEEIMLYMLENL